MTVISDLSIRQAFLIVLPEPLDTPGALVFVAHVVTECPLNTSSHVMPISIPHGFEGEELQWSLAKHRFQSNLRNTYRLGILDERFRHTHLPFVPRDTSVLQDLLTTGLWIPLPGIFASVGGMRGKKVESFHDLLEGIAISETRSTDANVFLQTKILDLMQNSFGIVLVPAPVLVRLDRSNVPRLGLHKLLDKGSCRLLESM